ncbi:MAG: hypothetical protein ACYC7F_13325, partial [Gemmatimonadaceae bacterium]
MRHTLRWAAAHPWVRGVIAGDASDVASPAGLRTASGRARRALFEVGAALRAQRDAPPAAAVDAVVPADTTPGALRVNAPDTLLTPRP